jgi:hypothetical protein
MKKSISQTKKTKSKNKKDKRLSVIKEGKIIKEKSNDPVAFFQVNSTRNTLNIIGKILLFITALYFSYYCISQLAIYLNKYDGLTAKEWFYANSGTQYELNNTKGKLEALQSDYDDLKSENTYNGLKAAEWHKKYSDKDEELENKKKELADKENELSNIKRDLVFSRLKESFGGKTAQEWYTENNKSKSSLSDLQFCIRRFDSFNLIFSSNNSSTLRATSYCSSYMY